MSLEDLKKLRQAIEQDARLEKELQALDDRDDFVVRVVHLAAERNLNVDQTVIAEAMRQSRREWIERWI